MSDPRPNIVQNYEAHLRALMDLYQAHRNQHGDFGQCGGVGVCLMMRTEVEAEQRQEQILREMAESGLRLRLEVAP